MFLVTLTCVCVSALLFVYTYLQAYNTERNGDYYELEILP